MFHGPGGLDLTGLVQIIQGLPGGLAVLGGEQIYGVVRRLEFGGEDLVGLHRGDGEGDEGGGDVLVQEGAGHGVLAADGGGTQLQLSVQRTQQGGEGLAPALGLAAQLLEELLEGEIGLVIVGTGGHQLGHGGVHGGVSGGIGVHHRLVGVKAPGHHAGLVGLLAGQHGEQGGHGLGGGALGLAAEGHEDGSGADGPVKPLGQAPAGAALQAGGHLLQRVEALFAHGGAVRLGHGDGGVLHCAVGVQEGPGQVGDGLALPVHDHAGAGGDHGHPIGLQVLRLGGGDELLLVLGGDDNGHALLALGDGQFGAVQAVVLLAHGIQLDLQTVGQLANGHGHAAGAKVVAALDEAGHVAVAEQALDLPLLGGVALLHLAGHGGQRLLVVALGGAGGTADAVTAGAAAQQDDHVAGGGALPDHVFSGGSTHHSAALQTLGDIALVVHLGHMAGGKADLVAVGGIARSGGGRQLALG